MLGADDGVQRHPRHIFFTIDTIILKNRKDLWEVFSE